MKVVANIGVILSSVVILSFTFNYNKTGKIFRKKAGDQTANFVVFSIDSNTVADHKNKRLNFYYHDSLAFGHPVVITGESRNLLLNAPTLLLESSAKQTPFLIYPGEKINVKYAGSDSVQMYIQGNAKRTNELNFFRKLVQKTGNVYYALQTMPYLKKVNTLDSIHSFEKTINTIKDSRLQFLNFFVRQSPVNDSFTEIAINSIKSKALNDSLLLYYNNRELLDKQNLYSKLISEKLTTIKNIGFVPYQIYYNACATLISLITSNRPNPLITSNADFIKRFDFVSKNFTGITRDFLLSNTLYRAYNNDVAISNTYLDKFNILCENEGYKKIIANMLNEKNADLYIKGSNKLSSADGKTVQDFQAVIANYKGKIALLDFWASWCSPCREEMPYFDLLKKAYKGKNIAFVSISSDAKINDWLKASKEESLENKNNFLLLNFDKSPFVKQYGINSIPRYMLIGKDGKIINADAPRPSDPKLKELIDKYL